MKLWKVQKVFGDVVYDLRNRRLLPVVILLIATMVAVPVLLSRGGSSSPTLAATSGAVRPDPHTESAVVSYSPPGVRNYKQRLSDQAPKDPFRSLFNNTGGAAAASQLNSTVTSPAPAAPASTSVSSSGPSVSGGSSGSTGSTTSAKPKVLYYHSVADLSFGESSQPLVRHRKMEAFGSLPTQEAPVLIYLGSSLDGKHAYFSVSTYSSQLAGPGACLPGPTDCSLLALGPGETETMVYSGDGKTYALKINKINRVVTKKPPAS